LAHAQINNKWKKSNFPPPTFVKVCFSSINFKTGQITSLNFSNRAFYLPGTVLKAVCYSKQWYATVTGGAATVPVFCLYLFYLFRLNLWKIIINHRKIIKWKI
jgi:hypothetical protein